MKTQGFRELNPPLPEATSEGNYKTPFSTNTIANDGTPSDPGGIDFRSVQWSYLAEGEFVEPGVVKMRSFGASMKAIRATAAGDGKVDLQQASALSARAFKTFLTIPERDLWVNLHPSQPDRIIAPTLGQTEVGRIMLEADFQLKKDVGKLMKEEPFVSERQRLVASIYNRVLGVGNAVHFNRGHGSTSRVEIIPDRVRAHESDTDIYLEDIPLGVEYELKGFEVYVKKGGKDRNITLLPEEKQTYARLIEEQVRPRLVQLVNQAPDYERLRQCYAARVLADWYKRKHRSGGAFSPLIDRVQLDGLKAGSDWSPKAFWQAYRHDYQHSSAQGFGGVNLIKLPTVEPRKATPEIASGILRAMMTDAPLQAAAQGPYFAGRMFVAIEALGTATALTQQLPLPHHTHQKAASLWASPVLWLGGLGLAAVVFFAIKGRSLGRWIARPLRNR